MQKDYAAILTKFNISPTAAKVYVALLELGKSSADRIAKKIGTYKANVYDALDRLMEAGLATYLIEERKRLYLPANPKRLIYAVNAFEQKALADYEELRRDIRQIAPDLCVKYNRIKEKDLFEVYRGREGYKVMITDILREKPKSWKGFGNLQVQEFFPYNFLKWFKNVKFMLFSTKSEAFSRRLKEAKKVTQVKIIFLPEDLYTPVVWALFGNNLLILIYEPEIIALRISSGRIVRTFSNQFDYLWKKHKTLVKLD